MERSVFGLHEQQMVADFQITRTGQPPSFVDMMEQKCSEHREACEHTDGLSPDELEEIKNDPIKARELGMEYVDEIIATLGALSILGQDFSSLFYQKMGVMLEKYPSPLIKELMHDPGIERRQAMATAKTIYGS